MNKFLTTFVFAALALRCRQPPRGDDAGAAHHHGTLDSPALAGNSVVAAAYKPEQRRGAQGGAGRPTPPPVPHRGGVLGAPGRVRQPGADATASEGGERDLYSGPTGGPLTKVESCPQSSQLVFPPGPALDGDTSIWSGEGCVPNRLRIQFGSCLASSSVGRPGTARRRGRFVAWVERTRTRTRRSTRRLTVYDAQAGSVAYSVVVPDIQTVQLNSDGTALVAPTDVFHGHGACGHDYPSRVAYYTVADPTLHSVPVTTCREQVALAGGRIASRSASRTGPTSSPWPTSTGPRSSPSPTSTPSRRSTSTAPTWPGARSAASTM